MATRSLAVLSVAVLLTLPHFAEGFSAPLLLRSPGQLSKASCLSKVATAPRARAAVSLQMQDSKTEEKTEVAASENKAEEPAKENMMTKVKNAGIAGLISYAAWEFVFWTISVPAAIFAYHQTTGEWPSFDNPESTAKVSAVIFGFLNVARALVPVRIGITLATVPLVDKYIVKPLGIGQGKEEEKSE